MKTYQATKSNEPFFKEGEERTREDWLKKLNLTDEQFNTLIECGGSMMERDSNIGLRASWGHISIGRENMPFSEDESKKIEENLLKAFPDLNDLLK